MAYPYYNPYQIVPVQTPPIPQNSMTWVSGESEASMYPIAPNAAVALWDRNGKTVYLKSADVTGKPTMKAFDLVERGTEKVEEVLPNYLTKEELDAVILSVDAIKKEIETMKGDLYGLAGKKKKKAEVEDE